VMSAGGDLPDSLTSFNDIDFIIAEKTVAIFFSSISF